MTLNGKEDADRRLVVPEKAMKLLRLADCATMAGLRDDAVALIERAMRIIYAAYDDEDGDDQNSR